LALRDYLNVLRRRWKLVILLTAVVAVVALIASLFQTRVYQGEARVLVTTPNPGATVVGSPLSGPQSNQLDRDLGTQVQLMQQPPLVARAIRSLGLKTTPDELLKRAKFTVDGQTNVVTVDVTDVDPARAAQTADALAGAYVEWSRDFQRASIGTAASQVERRVTETQDRIAALSSKPPGARARVNEAQLGAATAQYNALTRTLQELRLNEQLVTGLGSVVASAEVDPVPVAPSPVRNGAIGLVVGLVFGLGAAFLADTLDNRIRTPEEMAAAYDAPILARIPKETFANGQSRRLTVTEGPATPVAEAYRSLRNNLQFINFEGTITTLIVASAEPGEGKSTVAANLAAVLSQAGWRVVLVVSDFRRPTTQEFFDVDEAVGLSDVLAGRLDIADALQEAPGLGNLRILASGNAPPNPSEMLSSKRMAEVVTSLRKAADWVIIDTAPIMAVADAGATVRWADRVLVVGRLGGSKREATRKSYEQLQHVGAHVLGVVIVEAEKGSSASAHGGYAGYSDSTY